MAVYTLINKSQFEAILSYYNIGDLVNYTPIKSGTANTNYEFTTTKNNNISKYVLTIIEEKMSRKDISFCLDYTNYLDLNNIPVAKAICDRQRTLFRMLIDKYVVITPFLSGHHLMLGSSNSNNLTSKHCNQVGNTLANMHILGHNLTQKRKNPYGLAWCFKTYDSLTEFLPDETQEIINSEFDYLSKNQEITNKLGLFTGTVHADIFCDNILFLNDKLQGIIDFYHACSDYLLYDLAIVINDFAITPVGLVIMENYSSIINNYVQTLKQNEELYNNLKTNLHNNNELWQFMLRRAALCFWLMRLEAYYLPKDNGAEHSVKNIKDPTEFEIKLLLHRSNNLEFKL